VHPLSLANGILYRQLQLCLAYKKSIQSAVLSDRTLICKSPSSASAAWVLVRTCKCSLPLFGLQLKFALVLVAGC